MNAQNRHIDRLIARHLDGERLSDAEQAELLDWLRSSEEHRRSYLDAYDAWGERHLPDTLFDAEAAYRRLTERIAEPEECPAAPAVRRRFVGIACAAACTVLLVTGFFLRGKTGQQIPDIREFVQTAEAPVYTEKEVQLILSEQKTVRLEEKKSSIRYDAAEIHINEDARKPITKKEVAAFNQLLVPYGKQTTLTLADGTRVWVNAGSRLIYPSAFDDDRREIYAEGEIYIEVAHDAARPFTVHTGKMDVRVLGTRFYVSSYGRDRTQEVVLRSGSVNVAPADAPEHGIRIEPDQRASLDTAGHVPHPRGTRRRLHQLDSRILPLRQHAALRRTRTACPILQPDVRLLPRSRCHDHFGKTRTQRRSLRGAADSLAHGTDPVPSIRGGIPALLDANIRRQPKPNAYGKSRAELKKAGQRPPTPSGTK